MNPYDFIVKIIFLFFGALFMFFAFHGGFSLVFFILGAFLLLCFIGSFIPDKDSKKKGVDSDSDDDVIYSFNVAGVSYRQKDICDLCWENDEWSMSKRELIDMCMVDERIYQYGSDFGRVSLVPDPENEYDENAIKVMRRDILFGYVPKDETASVRRFISEEYTAIASAYGGPYKIITEDKDDGSYSIEKVQQTVGLHVTIRYLP